MLDKPQQQRVSRRCTTALVKAIDSLPELLEQTEAEKAALIVADLIKSVVALPKEQDGDTLEDYVAQCMEGDDENE